MSSNISTNTEFSKPDVIIAANHLSPVTPTTSTNTTNNNNTAIDQPIQPSVNNTTTTFSTDIADLRHTMEQQHLQQLKLKQMQQQNNNNNQQNTRDDSSNSQELNSNGSSINTSNNHSSDDTTNSPPNSSGNSNGAGPKIINFKNNIQQTTATNPDVLCSNCGTTKTPLWRRDERGYILCNACGLFFKLHGKPRPISLKTDVIRSRNRKTKIEKQKEKELLANSNSIDPNSTNSNSSLNGSNNNSNKNGIRKRKKKNDNVSASNLKSNGLISSAALLGSSGNSANGTDESFGTNSINSNPKSSAGSAIYSQSNGLIKIVPKSDGDYHHAHLQQQQQQSLTQPGFNTTNSYSLSVNGHQPSSASGNTPNSSKIIVLPQKHSNGISNGNQMLSLSQMGVSPRLGAMWQQQQHPSQSSPTSQLASFKSPTMLAIDKLASVSRQINNPVSSMDEIPIQSLNTTTSNHSRSNTVLPPISHFKETVSPSSNSLPPHNKLPNLKNILSSVETKPLSISSVLNGDSAIKTEADKDEQIKKLTTENKELELKLDICKNKIQELEQKLLLKTKN
ncbi:hypothetical protein ACO0SA_003323 [Hanseniaspora valbyensis]